jgi:hypothetical protein
MTTSMKFLAVYSISFLIVSNILGQDTINVIRNYNNDNPKSTLDSVFHNMPNMIFIDLDSGFDDSVCITVNSNSVLNKYLKTNESIDLAGSFVVSFEDSSDIKNLELKFFKGNFVIKEKINLGYKSLRIARYSHHWQLDYSNHFYMRE